MQLPLQIAFRNMDRSELVEESIHAKVAWLEKFHERLVGCRVVVEAPHRHHREGNQYRVRIDLSVPGEEIVVNREPPGHAEHQNLAVAIRDTFDAARRQLEEHVGRRRLQR
jgi:ribosome-associated translation inhibitor RaiA